MTVLIYRTRISITMNLLLGSSVTYRTSNWG